MKKLYTFIILTTVSLHSFSQDSSTESSSFKPSAKSFTAEVNFNPFSSSPISINYLRFRSFVSERNAFRIGLALGLRNQKEVEDVTQSSFDINLRPGYEWHFTGTEKLSPYIGMEVDLALKSSSYSDDRDSQNRGSVESVSGAWDTNGTERGFTRFGANFLIGADYYIVKRLYLGVEVGYGFQVINSADITTKFFSRSEIKSKGGSTFQIGPNYNSSIRLGFVF